MVQGQLVQGQAPRWRAIWEFRPAWCTSIFRLSRFLPPKRPKKVWGGEAVCLMSFPQESQGCHSIPAFVSPVLFSYQVLLLWPLLSRILFRTKSFCFGHSYLLSCFRTKSFFLGHSYLLSCFRTKSFFFAHSYLLSYFRTKSFFLGHSLLLLWLCDVRKHRLAAIAIRGCFCVLFVCLFVDLLVSL